MRKICRIPGPYSRPPPFCTCMPFGALLPHHKCTRGDYLSHRHRLARIRISIGVSLSSSKRLEHSCGSYKGNRCALDRFLRVVDDSQVNYTPLPSNPIKSVHCRGQPYFSAPPHEYGPCSFTHQWAWCRREFRSERQARPDLARPIKMCNGFCRSFWVFKPKRGHREIPERHA